MRRAHPEWQRFEQAARAPGRAQRALLHRLLQAGEETAFGRRHGFGVIRDVSDYQRRVPIRRYEDLRQECSREAAGEQGVLCPQPPICFEETGGSTGGCKLIPYTPALLESFQQGLLPWFAALLAHRPGIRRGRAYWATSPPMRPPRRTSGGIPVGLPHDGAYFGPDLEQIIAALAITPPFAHIPHHDAPDHWRYATLRALTAAEDLTLISVWSPSFLLMLLEDLPRFAERLLKDLEAPASALSPRRLKILNQALGQSKPDTRLLWPRLDTISCWTHAQAARFLPTLRERFPGQFIQGKGLVATEALITLPLGGLPFPVPAIASVFLEFLDQDQHPHLVDELQEGASYRVVITTAGGLYRYDLGDGVRVAGHVGALPLLEFLGRDGLVCDLCGEKLTEAFVAQRLPPGDGFVMLAPDAGDAPLRYRLFMDANQVSPAQAMEAAARMDRALEENPQYRQARLTGQLYPIEPCLTPNPLQAYMRDCSAHGLRAGVVKPPALRPETDWAQRLLAYRAEES